MRESSLHISSLASLPPEQRTAILAQLTDEQCEALLHDWAFLSRPEQRAPDGDWLVWIYLAGRGAGKTRSGAEWVRQRVKAGSTRIALIAPTAADARDVMVEGVSGLLSVCWEHDKTDAGLPMGRPLYEPSKRRVTWKHGAIATLFSAEEPDRLRGPQHDTAWCDELAAWDDAQSTWDMAMFGLRLGRDPRAMVTTTPKPLPIVRELTRDARNVVTRGTTWSNRANLAPSFFAQIVAKYDGTRLGRQELHAEILEEAEGALWTRDMLVKAARYPQLIRTVVGVDPPVSADGESALCGIVVAGLGVDGRGYVLADYSGRMLPAQWGKKVVEAYDDWHADRIVAEGNQGGEMVRHTIQTVRPAAPVTIVQAHHGKQARAEPVAALYEQGKVDHVGSFPELEDQMVTWEPLSGLPSPDRLDALVWAMTELAIGGGPHVYGADVQDMLEPGRDIPSRLLRCAAIDIEAGEVAMVWAAIDRTSGVMHVTDAVLTARSDLAVHAEAIRMRGKWVPVLFETEARKRSKAEGIAIAERLAECGVEIYTVDMDQERAVAALRHRIVGNALKVHDDLHQWITAWRRYRRNEKGELVQAGDGLMRATQLIGLYGPGLAISENQAVSDAETTRESLVAEAHRHNSTGY